MGTYRHWFAVIAVGFLLPLIGCSSATTTADFDQNYSFSSQGTFGFPTEEQYPSSAGDVPPGRMERIQAVVRNVLEEKGFTYSEKPPVDYIVALYGRVEEKVEMPDTDVIGYGLWPGWEDTTDSKAMGGQNVTTRWEEGTLIADVIDAKQLQAVWRGTAKAVVGEQPMSDSDLRKAVQKLFKDFPPSQASEK
jgi:hypothetical protein